MQSVHNKLHGNHFVETTEKRRVKLSQMKVTSVCVLTQSSVHVGNHEKTHSLLVQRALLHTSTNLHTNKQKHVCSPILVLMPWCLNLIFFLFSLSFGQSLGSECEFAEMSPQCFEFPLY